MSRLTTVRALGHSTKEDATETALDASTDDEKHGDEGSSDGADREVKGPVRRFALGSLIAVILLPVIALLLACGAGYLKWFQASAATDSHAAVESVRAASDNTIAILSYKADRVEQDLGSAASRLTGDFKKSYTSLTHDVVIPGAKEQQISSVATVPAAASMSATENHAVVLLFVNQTITMGQTPPADTASSVKVTLDKVGGHWLISGFDPCDAYADDVWASDLICRR